MSVNNYSMSENWGGQNPHSPTTGWQQYMAGSGEAGKRSFAQHRAAARIAQTPPVQNTLQRVSSPLQTGEVGAFAAEYRANETVRVGVLSPAVLAGRFRWAR